MQHSSVKLNTDGLFSHILRRLILIHQRLRSLDIRTGLPWYLAVITAIVTLCSTILFILTFYVHMFIPSANSRDQVDSFFYHDSDLVYIPQGNILITTTAKAGSATLWTWLHKGITGESHFACNNETYIQNFNSPCWNYQVVHPLKMSSQERWRIVHDPNVFRIAITRDPFQRLISAWKSKVACESDQYGTDVHDRDFIVPNMLNQAGLENNTNCLSLTAFANVLEKVRNMYIRGDFQIRILNKHFRPQEYFFDHINYDIVMDVDQLSNRSMLEPLVRRLKFPHLLKEAPSILHRSKKQLHIHEDVAMLLYRFAVLSESVPESKKNRNHQ